MVAPTMPRKEHNTSNNSYQHSNENYSGIIESNTYEDHSHSNGNNNNYNTCVTQ